MTEAATVRRDRVRLAGRDTDVVLGAGVLGGLFGEVRSRWPRAERVGLVIDRTVDALWPIEAPPGGPTALRVLAPAGEAAKRRTVLAELQDALLDLRRDEPVIVVGGGAVLDAAGFAAATVRRGLPWVAVPTTVVGMADAAVGGKVAVNHPRGKNLLGTFHPPALVLADVAFLDTLDDRDRVAGLAEVYKAGRVGDPDLVARLRRGVPGDAAAYAEVLARAVAVKARLVEADERDHGARRALNLGHTLGHALERLVSNERLRHGEAVAIGMAYAARLALARDRVGAAWVARQDEDLARLGLPTAPPGGLDAADVLEAMEVDKKRRPGARHVLVLPRAAGGVDVVEDVVEVELVAAWKALLAVA